MVGAGSDVALNGGDAPLYMSATGPPPFTRNHTSIFLLISDFKETLQFTAAVYFVTLLKRGEGKNNVYESILGDASSLAKGGRSRFKGLTVAYMTESALIRPP